MYELALSDNSTGYAHVQEVRGGQFHAKLTLPNENKQTALPGGACASAQLAALRVAKFKAGVLEVVKKQTGRAPRGSVRLASRFICHMHALSSHACPASHRSASFLSMWSWSARRW